VGARPFADIVIDGREVGSLPLPPLELAEGRHVVRFVHPDYQPLHRTVVVRAGETVKLFVDLSLDGIAR
jgi:serine/threonine-protein kinase